MMTSGASGLASPVGEEGETEAAPTSVVVPDATQVARSLSLPVRRPGETGEEEGRRSFCAVHLAQEASQGSSPLSQAHEALSAGGGANQSCSFYRKFKKKSVSFDITALLETEKLEEAKKCGRRRDHGALSQASWLPRSGASAQSVRKLSGVEPPSAVPLWGSPETLYSLKRRTGGTAVSGGPETSVSFGPDTGVSPLQGTGVSLCQGTGVSFCQETGVSADQGTGVSLAQETGASPCQATSAPPYQETSISGYHGTGVSPRGGPAGLAWRSPLGFGDAGNLPCPVAPGLGPAVSPRARAWPVPPPGDASFGKAKSPSTAELEPHRESPWKSRRSPSHRDARGGALHVLRPQGGALHALEQIHGADRGVKHEGDEGVEVSPVLPPHRVREGDAEDGGLSRSDTGSGCQLEFQGGEGGRWNEQEAGVLPPPGTPRRFRMSAPTPPPSPFQTAEQRQQTPVSPVHPRSSSHTQNQRLAASLACLLDSVGDRGATFSGQPREMQLPPCLAPQSAASLEESSPLHAADALCFRSPGALASASPVPWHGTHGISLQDAYLQSFLTRVPYPSTPPPGFEGVAPPSPAYTPLCSSPFSPPPAPSPLPLSLSRFSASRPSSSPSCLLSSSFHACSTALHCGVQPAASGGVPHSPLSLPSRPVEWWDVVPGALSGASGPHSPFAGGAQRASQGNAMLVKCAETFLLHHTKKLRRLQLRLNGRSERRGSVGEKLDVAPGFSHFDLQPHQLSAARKLYAISAQPRPTTLGCEAASQQTGFVCRRAYTGHPKSEDESHAFPFARPNGAGTPYTSPLESPMLAAGLLSRVLSRHSEQPPDPSANSSNLTGSSVPLGRPSGKGELRTVQFPRPPAGGFVLLPGRVLTSDSVGVYNGGCDNRDHDYMAKQFEHILPDHLFINPPPMYSCACAARTPDVRVNAKADSEVPTRLGESEAGAGKRRQQSVPGDPEGAAPACDAETPKTRAGREKGGSGSEGTGTRPFVSQQETTRESLRGATQDSTSSDARGLCPPSGPERKRLRCRRCGGWVVPPVGWPVVSPSPGEGGRGEDQAEERLGQQDVEEVSVLDTCYYQVLELVGRGTFGHVYECLQFDGFTGKPVSVVAVKVVKNDEAYLRNALHEVFLLRMLARGGLHGADSAQEEGRWATSDDGGAPSGEEPPGTAAANGAAKGREAVRDTERRVVRLLHQFVYRRHVCLVFELLHSDLYQLLKKGRFRGLPLFIVQQIAVQLVQGVSELQRVRIAHCDLKPENVLIYSATVTAKEATWEASQNSKQRHRKQSPYRQLKGQATAEAHPGPSGNQGGGPASSDSAADDCLPNTSPPPAPPGPKAAAVVPVQGQATLAPHAGGAAPAGGANTEGGPGGRAAEDAEKAKRIGSVQCKDSRFDVALAAIVSSRESRESGKQKGEKGRRPEEIVGQRRRGDSSGNVFIDSPTTGSGESREWPLLCQSRSFTCSSKKGLETPGRERGRRRSVSRRSKLAASCLRRCSSASAQFFSRSTQRDCSQCQQKVPGLLSGNAPAEAEEPSARGPSGGESRSGQLVSCGEQRPPVTREKGVACEAGPDGPGLREACRGRGDRRPSAAQRLRLYIRVVDFSSSCVLPKTPSKPEIGDIVSLVKKKNCKPFASVYPQSRFYGAPEAFLGVPYWEKVDLWAVGCILAELFFGQPLLPGASDYDQLRRLVGLFGLPPTWMLEVGTRSRAYFVADGPETPADRPREGIPSLKVAAEAREASGREQGAAADAVSRTNRNGQSEVTCTVENGGKAGDEKRGKKGDTPPTPLGASWRLKTVEEYEKATGTTEPVPKRYADIRCLSDLLRLRPLEHHPSKGQENRTNPHPAPTSKQGATSTHRYPQPPVLIANADGPAASSSSRLSSSNASLAASGEHSEVVPAAPMSAREGACSGARGGGAEERRGMVEKTEGDREERQPKALPDEGRDDLVEAEARCEKCDSYSVAVTYLGSEHKPRRSRRVSCLTCSTEDSSTSACSGALSALSPGDPWAAWCSRPSSMSPLPRLSSFDGKRGRLVRRRTVSSWTCQSGQSRRPWRTSAGLPGSLPAVHHSRVRVSRGSGDSDASREDCRVHSPISCASAYVRAPSFSPDFVNKPPPRACSLSPSWSLAHTLRHGEQSRKAEGDLASVEPQTLSRRQHGESDERKGDDQDTGGANAERAQICEKSEKDRREASEALDNRAQGERMPLGHETGEEALRQRFLEFLEGLLQVDPLKRFSAEDALAHPFIASALETPGAASERRHAGSESADAQAERQYRKWQRFHLKNVLSLLNAESEKQERRLREAEKGQGKGRPLRWDAVVRSQVAFLRGSLCGGDSESRRQEKDEKPRDHASPASVESSRQGRVETQEKAQRKGSASSHFTADLERPGPQPGWPEEACEAPLHARGRADLRPPGFAAMARDAASGKAETSVAYTNADPTQASCRRLEWGEGFLQPKGRDMEGASPHMSFTRDKDGGFSSAITSSFCFSASPYLYPRQPGYEEGGNPSPTDSFTGLPSLDTRFSSSVYPSARSSLASVSSLPFLSSLPPSTSSPAFNAHAYRGSDASSLAHADLSWPESDKETEALIKRVVEFHGRRVAFEGQDMERRCKDEEQTLWMQQQQQQKRLLQGEDSRSPFPQVPTGQQIYMKHSGLYTPPPSPVHVAAPVVCMRHIDREVSKSVSHERRRIND
ncbi:putative CMGC kinase [Toxoplasma gondii ARI]|uniref:Putative CMGC kinase n=1 Tax=Toxoplasma gondii ARI TaxID=1074872 RepID=A0A139YB99_TOXGO|nr:putative CMGC kinase [Toxoplasma gondii ARI]